MADSITVLAARAFIHPPQCCYGGRATFRFPSATVCVRVQPRKLSGMMKPSLANYQLTVN